MPYEPGRARRWARALAALAVAVLAAVPFTGALGHPFVAWDDDVNFALNPSFRGLGLEQLRWMWTSTYGGHYMPLTWMSCALDYQLAGGLDAGRFHATNLLLHALAALFLYLALVELLERTRVTASPALLRLSAALGALFFAVHPLRVESVVWATERRDVLSGAFFALSLWSWLRSQRDDASRPRWLVLSVASFAASLLSKASGMALPLVLLALDAWPLRRAERRGWRPLVVEKLPYLALAVLGGAIAWHAQAGAGVLASLDERPWPVRLAVSAYALRFYLRKTLWPFGLSPSYELPPALDPFERRYVVSLAFVALVTVFLFLRRKRPGVFAGAWTTWFAFCALIAPVIGLVATGRHLAGDRFTYLPSFAFAGAVAALATMAVTKARRPIVFALAGLALAALAILSWHQTGFWRDSRSLFERVVAVEPESYTGHHKLGILAHQRGDHAEALAHYDRALAARPGDADVRYDRALTWLARGDVERAAADLEATLSRRPAHLGALRVIADLELASGRPDDAVAWYRRALQGGAESPELHGALAALLERIGRHAEAVESWRRALALDPGFRAARDALENASGR